MAGSLIIFSYLSGRVVGPVASEVKLGMLGPPTNHCHWWEQGSQAVRELGTFVNSFYHWQDPGNSSF